MGDVEKQTLSAIIILIVNETRNVNVFGMIIGVCSPPVCKKRISKGD